MVHREEASHPTEKQFKSFFVWSDVLESKIKFTSLMKPADSDWDDAFLVPKQKKKKMKTIQSNPIEV